jgi:hypothetical protein
MIGIKLEGDSEFLDLPPDVEIQLTLENPILGDGERISPGSFSLPFNIPVGEVSPKNAVKFKHPDVIEAAEIYTKQRADLFYYGVPFKSGVLKSTTLQEPDIMDGNFLFGLSQIDETFKTADLRTVMDEPVVIDVAPVAKKLYIKRLDVDDWSLSINERDYEGQPGDIETAINTEAANSLDSNMIVPYATFVSSGTTPLGGITDDYLEIKLVTYKTILGVPTYEDDTDPLSPLWIKANDSEQNYKVESFDLDAYYDGFDTFFDGYITGAYPDDRFRIPLRLNSNKYKDSTVENSDIVNHVNVYAGGDGLLRNDPNYGILQFENPFFVYNRNSVQPFALLKYVLDKIATHFDFQYEGDFYTDPNVASILLDNTAALDDPQNFMGTKKFVFWRRSFNMNELVPSVKVVDFFAALQSRWNITIYYNEQTRKVRLNKREPLARSYTYVDITGVASKKNKPITDARVTGIKMIVPADPEDATSVQETYSIGIPEKEVPVKCGRLHKMTTFYHRSLIEVKQPFTTNFGFRVFSYRGILPSNSNSVAHPWAHIDGVGNDTFDIERIYETFWKYWLRADQSRRLVKIDAAFQFRFIRAINWETKYRFDRVNYLIKTIQMKLTNKGVRVSEVDLLSMQ